ncbi:SDR family NAD(P)-dependent oxidoreductase [Aquirufa ecclesiirivi]|uniref:SDR family NAD(P)-dependent oxidoreductase n=1 Tax=Aquirufa ecclesiirivi TaxID=2715124 RepID=UPI00140AAB39|nr:SDR family oxidoreductase [Aquirufa ecclesiirivi]MDF0693782.1 SDR family NAD(P)-dependent oxidoreductase [Aquirufa ecclesiirivi]NHC48460.1 SDR family oxidoreductase [Aquirufa ecclesiirivi]
MLFSLKNKKAVITGGGSGIGKAISLLFAKQGAEVHLIDLENASSRETERELKQISSKSQLHIINITQLDAVNKLASEIGNIDILINNAGIAQIGNIENTSSEGFQAIFDVNVKGAFHCMQAFIPGMLQHSKGVIVNMASVAASVGIPDRFGYSMTKGAIRSMTQSVAKDYVQQGIRCNCISPGRVHTPFVDGFIAKNYPDKKEEMFAKLSATQPIGRMAQPEEIAYLALYLCSDEASFITGCDYPIDGGFTYLNN